MTIQNPRVALTVPPDLNQILDDLARLQGIPKTKVILSILTEMQPILSELRDALHNVKTSSDPKSVLMSFGLSAVTNATKATADLASEVGTLLDVPS
jgi:repressor of nif and glnA expression